MVRYFKYLWGDARLSRNFVSLGGVGRVEYGSGRRWSSNKLPLIPHSGIRERRINMNDLCLDNMSCLSSQMKSHKDEILKSIWSNKWPQSKGKYIKTLALLQKMISNLSLANKDEEAMALISNYHSHIMIRYLAINRITSQCQLGKTDLMSDEDKHKLLNETKRSNFNSLPSYQLIGEVKCVEILNVNPHPRHHVGVGVRKGLGIHDRVLQTCVVFLLDPFYEARLHPDSYGFRRGRTTLNAVGLLKSILERADTHRLGVLVVSIDKFFDKISHDSIIKYFIVPKDVEPMLKRWLRPLIRNDSGKIIGTQTEGIAQRSVLGPLICNVIINELVFKVSVNSKTNYYQTKNTHRNIISYADDIIITTTNKEELKCIYEGLSKQFKGANLKLSVKIITHENDKEEFDFLGFTFLFVSKRRIRPGGIITRFDDVYTRKNSSTNNGTYLVYPNSFGFRNIKQKIKNIIKKLLHTSEISVFNEVNSVLRGYSNYYYWSDGYNRLKSLEGQTVMYIKKILIKKLRYNGIRRPVWVAQNFLVCKQFSDKDQPDNYRGVPSQVISPYNLRWHPHIKLKPERNNHILFLVMPTKINLMLPISTCTLPKNIRTIPYYSDPNLYADFWSKVRNRRVSNKSFYDLLFISQKGICAVCRLPLDEYNSLYDSEKLEIHELGSKGHVTENWQLLHSSCHSEITH